ncbi:unnamed protein product [Effrenium voratum]|nr:unnamed protein product [Effrenium voratum]
MERRVSHVGLRDCSRGWIRCRGLPFSFTSEEVADLFQEFDVTKADVTICMHRSGAFVGCSNGEAFVKCRDQETARRAVQKLHLTTVKQRYVETYLMSEEEIRGIAPYERQQLELVKHAEAQLIKARGVPFSSTTKDVAKFFSGFGVNESHVLLLRRPCGLPKGQALVWFSDPSVALAAREALHLKHMGKRYVELLPPGPEDVATALAHCWPCQQAWMQPMWPGYRTLESSGYAGAHTVPLCCDANGTLLLVCCTPGEFSELSSTGLSPSCPAPSDSASDCQAYDD